MQINFVFYLRLYSAISRRNADPAISYDLFFLKIFNANLKLVKK